MAHTHDLPNELWLAVFDTLLEPRVPARPGTALPAPALAPLLVCRRWKDLVEPLLYRAVSSNARCSSSNGGAAAALGRLARRDARVRANIARWTRRIDAPGGTGHEGALLGVLRAACGLRTLRLGCVRVPTLALAAAPAGLHALSLVLRDASALGALAHVGRMPRLRRLDVLCLAPGPIPDTVPAWRLPELAALAWRADDRPPAALGGALAFLARCELPALQELALAGPALRPADGAPLEALLGRAPALQHVDAWGVAGGLGALLPHAACARLTLGATPTPALALARAAELVLETHYAVGAPLAALDALAATAPGAGPRRVVLSMRLAQSVPFAWTTPPEDVLPGEHQLFVAPLRARALALARRGIQLLDETRMPLDLSALVVARPRCAAEVVDAHQRGLCALPLAVTA